MELRCAFMNCRSLYRPEAGGKRSSEGPADVETRLHHLARTIQGSSADAPDLVGLCEVGEEAIGKWLGDLLRPGRYDSVWSGTPSSIGMTGLQVLYNRDFLTYRRQWI